MPAPPSSMFNARRRDAVRGADSPSPPQTPPLSPRRAPLRVASPPWRSGPCHARENTCPTQKGDGASSPYLKGGVSAPAF
jgi:hypothetical protein